MNYYSQISDNAYNAPSVKVISFHSHGFLCVGSNESETGIDVGGGVETPGGEEEG